MSRHVSYSLCTRDWKEGSFSEGTLPTHKSSSSSKESSKVKDASSLLAVDASTVDLNESPELMAIQLWSRQQITSKD